MTDYCYDLENGIVYLAFSATQGHSFNISYIYSDKLDFAVSNWGNYPNYVFYYNEADANDNIELTNEENPISFNVYPNPLQQSETANLSINLKRNDSTELQISLYNIKGQKIGSFLQKQVLKGRSQINLPSLAVIKNLSSGVYFIKLQGKNSYVMHKLLILN